MALYRVYADAIVAAVVGDPEVRRRVDSILSVLPDFWGITGSVRNFWYMASFGDPSDLEIADRVCTGIAQATTMAIDRTHLPFVAVAAPTSRVHNMTEHTASKVVLVDGSSYVFDWHATLNAENPLVFPSVPSWERGEGGVTFQFFAGFD